MPKPVTQALCVLVPALLAAFVAATAAAAPARHTGGTFTFCSDITYPPEEFFQGTTPAGSDIDIGAAVAKQLGKKASFSNTGFDGIIAALLAKKCDAIISGMNDTAARRKQVDFVDYVNVGALLMVKKGNPSGLSTLASLSGKSVAVEAATTEKAGLDAENKTLKSQGKPQITIKIYTADTTAAAALLAGKVDAYFADSTPVLYYIKKTGGKFEVVGKQLETAPEGIATRKGDALTAQFKTAINKLYANGTMKTILAKWGLSAFALKK